MLKDILLFFFNHKKYILNKSMKKAVVLVSGGVDSSTVLTLVSKQDYEIYAISFDYGQKQVIELQKVKQLIKNYNVKEHKIITIDLKSFGSALVNDNIDVPKYEQEVDLGNEIPLTYVPARNTIFLSYALGFAETKEANDIFIGIHATDSPNYPDCRPEYIKSFEAMANLATSSGINGNKITIHAPLIDMTKTEIVRLGLKMGVDYSSTISCYDPTSLGESCGKCLACLVRIKAFEENGLKDPILYLNR